MYETFVRPRLEYATQVWSPHFKMDIDLIESVQRKFTKRIPGLAQVLYPDRILQLNLQSLELRRWIFDLVMVYKILYGLVEMDVTQFFTFQHSSTRGNSLKLFKNRSRYDCAKYFFSNRVVEVWNLLPDEIILQPSLQSFRSSLERFDLSRFLRGRGLDV